MPESYEAEVRIVESLTEAEHLIRGTFEDGSPNFPAGKERKVPEGERRETNLPTLTRPISASERR